MGNWGLFIETSKADFNRLFKELGERARVETVTA
jgi:roadblock/LC7 domain-containing protein